MADIFLSSDAIRLLHGKKILFFGDSNTRALYKDFICLLSENRLLTLSEMKETVPETIFGDRLTHRSALTKGRSFKEDREYKCNDMLIEFHFITKCLNEDVKEIFLKVQRQEERPPDIVIMNSTLWDVVRWGPKSVELFKENLVSLMRLFKTSLPKSTQVIWVTAPPVSKNSYGGFYLKQIEFTKYTMRFEVMEANVFAHDIISSYGYDMIDFHYYLKLSVHWRDKDGIHWFPKPMRYLTNLCLTHIALAWGVPLPGNVSSSELMKYKELQEDYAGLPVALPKVPLLNDDSSSKSSNQVVKFSSIGQRIIKSRTKAKNRNKNPFYYISQDQKNTNWSNEQQNCPSADVEQNVVKEILSEDFEPAGVGHLHDIQESRALLLLNLEILEGFTENTWAAISNQPLQCPPNYDYEVQNLTDQEFQSDNYEPYYGPDRRMGYYQSQHRYMPY